MTNPISGVGAIPSSAQAAKATGTREWGFMETLRGAMDQVNQLQGTADAKVGAMLQGNGMDVHSAMIAVEKSAPMKRIPK